MLFRSLTEKKISEENFPIFFQEKWRKSISETNVEVYYFHDEKNKSILAFSLRKIKFFKIANYLFTPLDLNGETLLPSIEKEVLDNFHLFLKSNRICDVIYPPQHVCVFNSIPSNVNYFPMKIIYISLVESEEIIFNKMNSKYKNEIRKAIKSNAKFICDQSSLDDFYLLYKLSHEKQKLVFENLDYFKNLSNTFFQNILISSVELNSQIESSSINLFDKNNAYYLYASNKEKTQIPGSNKFLIWENIQLLKNKGIKKYILGGYRELSQNDSKHYKIQNFKMKFGSELDEGYHFIKIINTNKYFIFQFLLKIKSLILKKDLSMINLNGLNVKKSK